jgi:hypothetical protein
MAVAALVISIVAVVFAGVAAVAAVWSAVIARRSARSSDSSARSAAEAVDLERVRQHHELTPRIRLEESQHGDAGEGVWFVNDGPLDYDSVTFTFAESDRPGPVVGLLPVDALQVGHVWATSADLGPMTLGDRRLLLYRRSENRRAESTLRLRVTCSKGSEVWQIPAEVEITPKPFIG